MRSGTDSDNEDDYSSDANENQHPIWISGPALARHFYLKKSTWLARFLFHVSGTRAHLRTKHHNVAGFNGEDNNNHTIKVGVIPSKTIITENLVDQLIKEQVDKNTNQDEPGKLVIFSVTDHWEVGEEGMLTAMQPKDWAEVGNASNVTVEQVQVVGSDFKADLPPESILAEVYRIQQILAANPLNTVYFHCKAGKARSTCIVAAYISIFGETSRLTLDDELKNEVKDIVSATKLLKSGRPYTDLHEDNVEKVGLELYKLKSTPEKIMRAQQAVDLHQELTKDCQARRDFPKDRKNPNLNECIDELTHYMTHRRWSFDGTPVSTDRTDALATLAFKNYIIQTTAFKQLAILATSNGLFAWLESDKPTDEDQLKIQELFSEMYRGRDFDSSKKWFEKLDKTIVAFKDDQKVKGRPQLITQLEQLQEDIQKFQRRYQKKLATELSTPKITVTSTERYHATHLPTYEKINQRISVAKKIQKAMISMTTIDNESPKLFSSPDTVSKIKINGKDTRIILTVPAKIIMDIFDEGLSIYSYDNRMDNTLKKVAGFAMLTNYKITNKNGRPECAVYTKFEDLIDIRASIKNIKSTIANSKFELAFGGGEWITNGARQMKVPKHVAEVWNLIEQSPELNADLLQQILHLVKVKAGENRPVFRYDSSKDFYNNFERMLVLKEGAALENAGRQIVAEINKIKPTSPARVLATPTPRAPSSSPPILQ